MLNYLGGIIYARFHQKDAGSQVKVVNILCHQDAFVFAFGGVMHTKTCYHSIGGVILRLLPEVEPDFESQ